MSRNVQDRNWWVEGDPLIVDDEESLGQALGDVVTILTRVGGGFNVVAQRREVAPGNWQNVGFVFQWVSYVPGERYQEPEPEAAPADDVPVAA